MPSGSKAMAKGKGGKEQEEKKATTIDDIPPEVLNRSILRRLPARDLCHISATSHKWRHYNYSDNNDHWKQFYTSRWAAKAAWDADPVVKWQSRFSDKMWEVKSYAGKYKQDICTGHVGPVKSVKLLPSHGLLASGSLDRRMRLWDLKSSAQLSVSRALGGTVRAIAMDSSTLFAGCADNLIRYWEPTHSEQPHSSKLDYTDAVYMEMNGDEAAAAAAAQQPLFDVSQQERVLRGHIAPLSALSLTDECLYSGAWDYSVRTWQRDLAEQEGWICVNLLKFDQWPMSVVARGKLLYVAAGTEVLVCDAETYQVVRQFQHLHDKNDVSCVEATHSGRTMFTAAIDGLVLQHDLRMRHPSHILWHYNKAVNGLAMEDPWLASCAGDGTVMLINIDAPPGLRTFDPSARRHLQAHGNSAHCIDMCDQWVAAGGKSKATRTFDFSNAMAYAKAKAAAKAGRGSRKERRRQRAEAAGAAFEGGSCKAAAGSCRAAGGSSREAAVARMWVDEEEPEELLASAGGAGPSKAGGGGGTRSGGFGAPQQQQQKVKKHKPKPPLPPTRTTKSGAVRPIQCYKQHKRSMAKLKDEGAIERYEDKMAEREANRAANRAAGNDVAANANAGWSARGVLNALTGGGGAGAGASRSSMAGFDSCDAMMGAALRAASRWPGGSVLGMSGLGAWLGPSSSSGRGNNVYAQREAEAAVAAVGELDRFGPSFGRHSTQLELNGPASNTNWFSKLIGSRAAAPPPLPRKRPLHSPSGSPDEASHVPHWASSSALRAESPDVDLFGQPDSPIPPLNYPSGSRRDEWKDFFGSDGDEGAGDALGEEWQDPASPQHVAMSDEVDPVDRLRAMLDPSTYSTHTSCRSRRKPSSAKYSETAEYDEIAALFDEPGGSGGEQQGDAGSDEPGDFLLFGTPGSPEGERLPQSRQQQQLAPRSRLWERPGSPYVRRVSSDPMEANDDASEDDDGIGAFFSEPVPVQEQQPPGQRVAAAPQLHATTPQPGNMAPMRAPLSFTSAPQQQQQQQQQQAQWQQPAQQGQQQQHAPCPPADLRAASRGSNHPSNPASASTHRARKQAHPTASRFESTIPRPAAMRSATSNSALPAHMRSDCPDPYAYIVSSPDSDSLEADTPSGSRNARMRPGLLSSDLMAATGNASLSASMGPPAQRSAYYSKFKYLRSGPDAKGSGGDGHGSGGGHGSGDCPEQRKTAAMDIHTRAKLGYGNSSSPCGSSGAGSPMAISPPMPPARAMGPPASRPAQQRNTSSNVWIGSGGSTAKTFCRGGSRAAEHTPMGCSPPKAVLEIKSPPAGAVLFGSGGAAMIGSGGGLGGGVSGVGASVKRQ